MPIGDMFARDGADQNHQIDQVLAAVRSHLKMDIAFVSEFVDGRRHFRHVAPETNGCVIRPGGSDPLPESYCFYVANGTMPGLMRDAAEDPIAARLAVTRALPVGAHLSVPIAVDEEGVYGTLCCFSFAPDHTLTPRDLDILTLCARIIGRLLRSASARKSEDATKADRIGAILDGGRIGMALQPIYRLADDRLVSFEALARFAQLPVRAPDEWFKEAASIGRGRDLEYLALEEALRLLPELPLQTSLSVNLSPLFVCATRLARLFEGLPLHRIVLELTEHDGIEDYSCFNRILEPFRQRGLRVAIDDVGAGHSCFRHVIEMQPNLIKLDRTLTCRVDTDRARRALADSVTRFGRAMGCEVVAEGVETQAEFDVLRDLGTTKVQGFLTGRPLPVAEAVKLPLRRRRPLSPKRSAA